MGVTTTLINKPFNPRAQDQSPKGYNRAALYSGKALDFDGVNDSVFLSDFVLTGNTVSISFYLNWDDYGTDTVQFICEGDNYNDLMIHIGGASGINGFRFATTFTTFDSVGVIQKGYNFYTLTTDGTTANAYVNGVLFNSEQVNLGTVSITELGIGNRQLNNTLFLDGQLSGFKIFNTALTAAQVADLYNNPEKVVPTGVDNTALKLWLPMMEGAGTTAYDGSGNNLGSEEVTNGDFATDSDWTKEAGWTISGGKATLDGSANTNALYQNIGGVSGTKYLLSFEVTDYVSGSVKAYLSSGDVSAGTPSITANGKYVFDITATGVLVLFRNETSFNGSIDNVSVKELTSYGTISGATWTHGIGAPVSQTSLIDWNKWTLDGTNDALIPQGLTSGRDLLGNLFENVRKQGALNLDGNSWAEVHDNASLDITSAISLEAWAYVPDDASNKILLSKWSPYATAKRSYLLFLNNSENIYFGISLDGQNSVNLVTSSTYRNSWFHFVATYDGANMKIFANGAEVTSQAQTGSIYSGTFQLEIGKHQGDLSAIYPNQLAQPRIYNRALTASEIQQNYNAGKNIYTN